MRDIARFMDALLDRLEDTGADRTRAVYLADLEGVLGARRVLWVEPREIESRYEVHGSGTERCARRVDPALFELLRPGEVRHLDANELERSFRSRASGSRRLTLVGGPTHGSVLWIESARAVRESDGELRAIARSIELLFRHTSERDSREGDDELKLRGVAALALAHDIRHELSLALLCCARAKEADGEEKTIALGELERVLEKARAVAEDGLAKPQGARSQSLKLKDLLAEEARTAGRVARNAGTVGLALLCSDELRVSCAPSILARLVRNLLLNALHASPAGERVRLSARRVGERVAIEIEDRGKGMEEAEAQALFTSATSGGAGAGLGTLSILACVESLAAEIEVESAPGAGTLIRLRVPAADAVGAPGGLLLIDADAERREERRTLLARADRVVRSVGSARDALREFERSEPNKIVLARGAAGHGCAELSGLSEFIDRARSRDVELVVIGALDSEQTLASL